MSETSVLMDLYFINIFQKGFLMNGAWFPQCKRKFRGTLDVDSVEKLSVSYKHNCSRNNKSYDINEGVYYTFNKRGGNSRKYASILQRLPSSFIPQKILEQFVDVYEYFVLLANAICIVRV